ncbi:hypothetical protein [Mycoplasma sp. CSL7503-lung]|uniref:hypothetical protein n=1 Tax=Mycoplasma sp. CSL7503-lung TaxID=536372 RepID=UPI0021CF1529|nr:hypothetical protein [Mycoplasma sp. CSL7503-lung]MCU4706455.1 hypothetical protein [Mycoplasma sp. CSL7503-lung]
MKKIKFLIPLTSITVPVVAMSCSNQIQTSTKADVKENSNEQHSNETTKITTEVKVNTPIAKTETQVEPKNESTESKTATKDNQQSEEKETEPTYETEIVEYEKLENKANLLEPITDPFLYAITDYFRIEYLGISKHLEINVDSIKQIKEKNALKVQYQVMNKENHAEYKDFELSFSLELPALNDKQTKAVDFVKKVAIFITTKQEHYDNLDQITPQEIIKQNLPEGIIVEDTFTVTKYPDLDAIEIGYTLDVDSKKYQLSYFLKRPHRIA